MVAGLRGDRGQEWGGAVSVWNSGIRMKEIQGQQEGVVVVVTNRHKVADHVGTIVWRRTDGGFGKVGDGAGPCY